ncbi:MAG: D-alanyl-D-alanine carboxypeptidase [Rickettsiales bacterium]|jgi:D-alanyl-D-alanine carboxypeptidase (penicillin-binding protein 5/6)|nr:D-alanyl-D-alanine carboxypeptidase [Rickettsiales bacterium]
MSKVLVFLLLLAAPVFAAPPPDLKSPYAILMDYDSGRVLYEKNSAVPASPSSMSKMLSAYRVFELLRAGKFTLDTQFVVGAEAWKKAKEMNANSGSTMFLEYGEKVRVEDLIRGLIVNSGNDAAVVLAENISGSEANFVVELNQLAARLGLVGTTILNSSGWYEKDHLMSAADLAVLSRRLIWDFPEYYHYFGEKEFLYRRDLTGNKDNRNKLLWIMPSADGLKTGHTSKGGYGLAASAKKGERRLISVINGLKGVNPSYNRFAESKALLDWGFKEFSNYVYFTAESPVVNVPVWFGAEPAVATGAMRDVLVTNHAGAEPAVEMYATFDTPVQAPVKKGQKLGVLTLYSDGAKADEYELVALDDVSRSNFVVRIFQNLKQLLVRMAGK